MGGASSTPAPVLQPDDVILEILRVPPEPVYLLRASLVCKKWRPFVRDPAFLRRYRARHRHAAPLLGFFYADGSFVPAGEQPDRVAAGHFSQLSGVGRWQILGSRHGRVLLATTDGLEPSGEHGDEMRIQVSHRKEQAEEMELLVWDPMTGRRIYFPPPRQLMYPTANFTSYFRSDRPEVEAPCVRAALICDHDGDGGEDCCHSRPFRVAILFQKHGFLFASVYSSQTGAWGAMMPAYGQWCMRHHWKRNNVLVGNVIYWPEDRSGCMFGYDLNTKDRSDTMFGYDPDTSRIQGVRGFPHLMKYRYSNTFHRTDPYACFQLFKSGDGQIGIAVVKGSHLILFAPKADSKGIPEWSEYRDLDLDELLAPPMGPFQPPVKKRPVGFDEEGNTIFLETTDGVIALHLESLKVKKVIDAGMVRPYRNVDYNTMIPYMSFFVPGDSAGDGGANEGAAEQMM